MKQFKLNFRTRWLQVAICTLILTFVSIGQMWGETVYYIAGESGLTGESWNCKADAFSGSTLTFSGISKGGYEFKLIKVENGGDCQWLSPTKFSSASGTAKKESPSNGNEKVGLDWKSDLTFTLNTGTETFTLHGDPILYVIGNADEDSNGHWCSNSAWTQGVAGNKLTSTGTAGKYSVTFSNVDEGDYKFKVTDGTGYTSQLTGSHKKNDNITLGSDGDGNITFSTKGIGATDLTVLVDITGGSTDPSKWKVSVTVKLRGLSVTASPAAGGSPTISATSVNKGSSVTVTANEATGYQFTGWTTDGSGTFGNTSATSTSFTPAASDETVTASYSARTYTITYYDKGGSSYSGSNEGSLPDSYTYGVGVDLVDGIKSNYRFDGWFDNSSCTGSAVTSISTTDNGDKTFYAKWTENPGGTVTLTAGTGGQVSKDGSSWSTSKSYSGIKTTDALNIYAQANTGYSFSSWSLTSGTGTIIRTDLASTTYTPVANADAELTANFSEVMSSLTTSCHYDAGNPSYSIPTKSVSSIGIATTATLTATTPSTGYTFAGWTLSSNLVVTSGDKDNDLSITVRTNGNGAAATAQANYDEDLSSTWKILGGTNLTGDNWNEHAMTKKTGHSTESVAYYTFDISSTNSGISGSADAWSFKIKNGDTWYGLYASGSYWWKRGTSANQSLTGEQNIQICADVAGPYEVKVDYSGATPTVTVTFPTAYTVTFSASPAAAADAPTAYNNTTKASITSGSSVLSGNSITFTQDETPNTGYTFSRWDKNSSSTGESGDTYTTTISGTTSVVAVYTENEYNVAVSDDGHGSVSPTGTVSVKQVNGTELTATPNTNYVFKDWTIADGGITPTTSSTNPQVFKATETGGSIQANFRSQWSLVGAGEEFGNWDATAHSFGNFGTNGSSQDTCTVELTLPANTNFTFKVYDYSQTGDDRYWGNSTDGPHYMNYASNNKQWWGFNKGNSYKNCGLTTAGAGTYKFEWNITTKQLRVYFPTSYTVTFGYGTGGSEVTATVEDATTITSGQYAAAGKDITFTQSAADGYTFKGWYDASSGGTAISCMSTSDNVYDDIAANINVYAQYTEDLYTITLTQNESDWGTAHVTESAATSGSAGIATSLGITATKKSGYRFIRWTQSGTGTAVIANDRAESTTVTVTGGDVTLTAEFGSNWVVGGNAPFLGKWKMEDAISFDHFTTSDGVTTGWIDIPMNANVDTFEIKVYNHDGGVWYGHETTKRTITYTSGNGVAKEFNRGGAYQNLKIVTAGKGDYRFTLTITASDTTLTIDYPTSYTITYGSKTYYGDDESSDASATGGSITSVVDNDDNALASGKYVVGTGSVTFTTSTTTNYTLTWYSDDTYETPYVAGGGVTIGDNSLTLSSLTADKGVYAKFAENMTTVNLVLDGHGKIQYESPADTWNDAGSSITAGTVTTRSIKAVADWGYYFAGWKKTACTDYSINVDEDDEDDVELTLSGLGEGATSGQTLTAKFLPLEKVYLQNVNWAATGDLWPTTGENHIYAYFGLSEESGSPKSANTDDPYYIQQMASADATDLYAYVPRAVTRGLEAGTYGSNEKIAFSNHNFGKNYRFLNYEAIYWGSYRQILNRFIPKGDHYRTVNGTKLYEGYWMPKEMVIGEEAGYYLKRRTGTNTYTDAKGEPKFVVVSNYQIQCKLRIDDSSDANNYYMIHSAGGVKYTTAEWPQHAEAPTVTTAKTSGIGVTQNSISDSRFLIKQTSQGFYTITLSFTLDTMYMNVNYPVAVGDYRMEHTYTKDAVTKKTHSGIIKKPTTETSENSYAFSSMYINTEDGDEDGNFDGTLKFQKCTAINASGYPVWSSGTAVTGFTSANFKEGNGVYEFRVNWDNSGKTDEQDVTSATLSYVDVYDGNYYIKTDYAPGGWVSYHANVMEENTINFNPNDPKTYDYFLCEWISKGEKNVKCVIANVWNEELCDTLYGDATYLGYDGSGKPSEYLPYEASVRFSYNSKTNELKRAYLNGSNEGLANYLYLQGTSESASRILDEDGNPFTNNIVKFKDRGNWIYEIDLKAEEGARVRLISDYYWGGNHHDQYMKGASGDWSTSTTSLLLGGDDTDAAHLVRVVYDFKTNQLISAWLAGGEEGETRAINTNAMIIREHQEQARQITFASSGLKLTDVDTLYSVMKFNKWTLNNKSKEAGHAALDPAKSQYERDLFWISFPYDVRLSDVFGFGKYMQHWAIMYYDGRNRAKNGFWAESKSNWKFIPANKKDTILHAFEGYVLALDLDELRESSKVFELVEDIYLYFPSMRSAGSIVQQDTTVAIDTTGYHCNINWTVQSDGVTPTGLPASYDRRYRDSHWHCIGVPSFHNVSHDIASYDGESEDPQPWIDSDGDGNVDMPNPDYYDDITDWEASELPYFYEWNMSNNEVTPKTTASYTFKSMYSYLVQYANDHIKWRAVTIAPKPKSVVERRKARLADDHFVEFNLNLLRDEQSLDHTYVRLTDNENVTADFEFGQDLCKEFQSGANIYTMIDQLEVAGNSLPLNTTGTTIVPVGVKIEAEGEYTFSMPEGTNGVSVVLIDNSTGTRTNLGLIDYTVTLEASTINDRFWLEISPVDQILTDIDNSGVDSKNGVRKEIIDGILYIVKDGEIFDARGNRVR